MVHTEWLVAVGGYGTVICSACLPTRYWSNLSEVKQKVREQQKKREMATNRLRMKLYQQVGFNKAARTYMLYITNSNPTGSVGEIETEEKMKHEHIHNTQR